MALKRSFTDPVSAKREKDFAENGIDAFHGRARFTAPDTVEMDGRALTARHVLIATSARPAPLRFSGAEHLTTSDSFLELDHLPDRIAIVGGGYIAARSDAPAFRSRIDRLADGEIPRDRN
jgi:glutathione reductase (NADPH)